MASNIETGFKAGRMLRKKLLLQNPTLTGRPEDKPFTYTHVSFMNKVKVIVELVRIGRVLFSISSFLKNIQSARLIGRHIGPSGRINRKVVEKRRRECFFREKSLISSIHQICWSGAATRHENCKWPSFENSEVIVSCHVNTIENDRRTEIPAKGETG